MSAATDERTHTDILEALDFEESVPCDRTEHESGGFGCTPGAPARWRILVAHTERGCEFAPSFACEGGLAYEQGFLSSVFTLPPGALAGIATCARCGNVLTKPADLLIVIGEV